jgi:hypothetical protein
MWPAFLALTVVDGIIGMTLPEAGDSTSFVGAMLFGGAVNLVALVLLSRPLGMVVTKVHPEFPSFIARDYAGTAILVVISAVLLAVGLGHRASVRSDGEVLRDAIVRAQAFIGDRAPAVFQRNLGTIDTFVIQPRTVYRMCVPAPASDRTYCVIVRMSRPFNDSVAFAGYEPNEVLEQGTQ